MKLPATAHLLLPAVENPDGADGRLLIYPNGTTAHHGPGGELRDMAIGPEHLRRFRDSRGWNLEQCADALGVTEGSVRHWEAGRRKIPRAAGIILYALTGGE